MALPHEQLQEGFGFDARAIPQQFLAGPQQDLFGTGAGLWVTHALIACAFYGTVVILLGSAKTAGNTFSNSCLVDERVWLESENGAAVKFIACILIEAASLATLVSTAKLRWRIERDYQELKQEHGLGHYEGRSWRGFHHHASLCVAAYGFLISQRRRFPPQRRPKPKTVRNLPFPMVIDPADPPIRPGRHVPKSFATVRRHLTVALSRSLQRCPCCTRTMPVKIQLVTQ
jgi:hypothetical protein